LAVRDVDDVCEDSIDRHEYLRLEQKRNWAVWRSENARDLENRGQFVFREIDASETCGRRARSRGTRLSGREARASQWSASRPERLDRAARRSARWRAEQMVESNGAIPGPADRTARHGGKNLAQLGSGPMPCCWTGVT
jgi:hypothetical protein